MQEITKKYMKVFRQRLRENGFDSVRSQSDKQNIIAGKDFDEHLFPTFVLFDYSDERPDGTILMTIMISNLIYELIAVDDEQIALAEEFECQILEKFNIEHGFTGRANGDFLLISDDDDMFVRKLTFFKDIEFSTITLSGKYLGQDELVGIINDLIDKYHKCAEEIMSLWSGMNSSRADRDTEDTENTGDSK